MNPIMLRRDFIKMLALLAAGAAAKPEQIAAFEKYYDINSPTCEEPFVAIDDISISGLAVTNSPLSIIFTNKVEPVITTGMNAFGGIYVWRAAPDGKIVIVPDDFRWRMQLLNAGRFETPSDQWMSSHFQGHIRYIDQSGVRRTQLITKAEGKLIS